MKSETTRFEKVTPSMLRELRRVLRRSRQPEVVGYTARQLVHESHALGTSLFELVDDAEAQVEFGTLLGQTLNARDLRRECPRLGIDVARSSA